MKELVFQNIGVCVKHTMEFRIGAFLASGEARTRDVHKPKQMIVGSPKHLCLLLVFNCGSKYDSKCL